MRPSNHSKSSLPMMVLFNHLELHNTGCKRKDVADILLILVFTNP